MCRLKGRRVRRLLTALAVLSAGAFQFGFIPSCESALTTLNPGGTILGSVSPEDIDLLFTSIPDWGYDPTCTIPGFGFDPESAGAVPSGECADQPVFPHTPGIRP
ncbi:MAG: hypothetical protein KAV82_12885 [Phycisphaerae bacterium]|nr:hypothetical protein [Phycisphaerae bacterium]